MLGGGEEEEEEGSGSAGWRWSLYSGGFCPGSHVGVLCDR